MKFVVCFLVSFFGFSSIGHVSPSHRWASFFGFSSEENRTNVLQVEAVTKGKYADTVLRLRKGDEIISVNGMKTPTPTKLEQVGDYFASNEPSEGWVFEIRRADSDRIVKLKADPKYQCPTLTLEGDCRPLEVR
jgi:hypothetical protein